MEHAFGGPTRPGDWLEFDSERRCVYLKGEAPEPVVGRGAQEPVAEPTRTLRVGVCIRFRSGAEHDDVNPALKEEV